ncbi:MAG: hypothetical protein IIV87_05895 [Oscillospiraceae bacterium]|nr:hypothetical protein [Oscillospiraceae bacterium]
MKEKIARILDGYGSEVRIEKADGVCAVRAFIQPVTANGWDSMRKTVRELGQVPVGRFVYIGPAEPFAQEGDRIVCADKTYTVCRAEHMVFGNEELYTWGLLREIGGSAVWKN